MYIIKADVRGFSYYLRFEVDYSKPEPMYHVNKFSFEGLKNNATLFDGREKPEYFMAKVEAYTNNPMEVIVYRKTTSVQL